MSRKLGVVDLGHQSYRETLELQRRLREARLDGSLDHDVLLLVEHDPVYTLGRGTQQSSLPLSETMLRARGADVIEIERGGDVTWHGPGQLVGYPILNLTEHRQDLHWYLRQMERVLIDLLAQFDVRGDVVAGKTGVWVKGRKIASIGIHVRRWVTMHGFAINVDPDLNWFSAIVPCGLTGVEMTSLANETGHAAPRNALWQQAQEAAWRSVGQAFTLEPVAETLDQLLPLSETASKGCQSGSERPTFMHHG